jgi:adenine-specific DNA-methyltransferase
MARLEELTTSVSDGQLQTALFDEVKALKERTPFGLVFERHIPETVALAANGGLKVDDHVRLRTDPGSRQLYRVTAIKGKKATIADDEEATQSVAIADLLAVRRFGDPSFPALTSLGQIKGSKERPFHTVINGENYHALQLLEHACAGQADCIYIDPPYNSGARDWKYNNDYVDATDRWRHSKWLSMMEKRLRIAKNLLKPDGVLICTIDENEVNHLGLLLEEIFPEYLRYMVTIVINPKGTAKVNFGRVEEYAIFLVPDTGVDVIAQLAPPEEQPDAELTIDVDEDDEEDGYWYRDVEPNGDLRLPPGVRDQLGLNGDGAEVELTVREDRVVELRLLDEEEDEDEVADGEPEEAATGEEFSVLYLRRRGAESSYREQRYRQFYAIKINEKTKRVVGIGPPLELKDKFKRNQREGDVLWVYPIDEDGNYRVWRYGRDTMERYIQAGEIRVGKHDPKKKQPYTLNHYKPRTGPRRQRVRTVWWRTAHDAGTHGTTLISRMLGKANPFPFPKSVYAVKDCLEAVVRDRKDALIVDFFAGSGTTLHSTCLLNAEDDGRRRCILVTNNEVEEKVARRLNRQGIYRGDAEFEAHGIFEAATKPRIEAVLTGKRPDGKKIPKGKKFQHLDGRPFADGFDCAFFRLDYLDPDEIELGRKLKDFQPLLWLTAGARETRPKQLAATKPFHVFKDAGYAVLLDEVAVREMVIALNDVPDVSHVFLVTSSEDAYAEMCEELGPTYRTEMLYRDYLRHFRSSRPL